MIDRTELNAVVIDVKGDRGIVTSARLRRWGQTQKTPTSFLASQATRWRSRRRLADRMAHSRSPAN